MKLMPLLLALALAVTFGVAALAQEKAQRGKLSHVVSFKFKDTATPEQIKKVESSFLALQTKIKEIKSLEWGTNNSPEKLNQGFTHCWILTFDTEKDRDAYLVHPDHKEFGKGLAGLLDKVFVIDFTAQH